MFKCYMKHMKQKYIEDDNNQLRLESILLPADKISAACLFFLLLPLSESVTENLYIVTLI
jgi:hypothetical protein